MLQTRNCYCKICSTYFECNDDEESGIAIDATDVGICHNCLIRESPYLIAKIIEDYIKQIYIIMPENIYD